MFFFNFNSFNFTKKRLGSRLGSLVHLASLFFTVAHLLVPLIGLVQCKVIHDMWQPIMIEHRQKTKLCSLVVSPRQGPASLPAELVNSAQREVPTAKFCIVSFSHNLHRRFVGFRSCDATSKKSATNYFCERSV